MLRRYDARIRPNAHKSERALSTAQHAAACRAVGGWAVGGCLHAIGCLCMFWANSLHADYTYSFRRLKQVGQCV